VPKTQTPKKNKKTGPKSNPTPGTPVGKNLAMASGSAVAVPAAKTRMPASFADLDRLFYGRNPKNPLRPPGFLGKVFDFFSSLKLAVILLTVLGAVCVVGTVYESNYTADLAKRLVYRTSWFDFLLAAIFVNVVFATLSRYPWKFQQSGWLLTHLGVLTIIVGSVLTHRYGVEGNMMLFEGQSSDRITLPTSTISVQKVGDNARYKFDTTEVEWGNPAKEAQVYPFQELGLQAVVDNFYPDSELGEVWSNDAPSPNPAVKFAIESSFAGPMAGGWLAPNIAGKRSVNMGPATITAKAIASREELAEALAPKSATEEHELGWLSVVFNESGERYKVDVAKASEGPVPIGETGYSVVVTDQLDYAYLNPEQQLENNPSREPNPLAVMDFFHNGEKVAENQFEFANIPEFESMHGITGELPFKATYHHEVGEGSGGGAAFELLLGPEEEVRWKVTTSTGNISSGTMEVGRPVPMPMMTAGMSLIVDEFYPNARMSTERVSKPIKRGKFLNKAAHLKLVDEAGNEKAFWLETGAEETVMLGDDFYRVAYKSNVVPLGFSIELQDFRLMTYPGSDSRPMSYESDVKVVGQSANERVTRDVTILMNEPMDHNGYRVFQSSYLDEPKGDPKISIFSIAKDPGIPIIYFGSIILCVGIAMMFWAKPYLRKLETRWTAKKEVPAT
jgi:hypothetical protein